MILLKGHAVTLTFKVAAQMLHVTRRLNMVIISVKLFQNLTTNKELWARHNFAARSCCDLDLRGIDPNVARDTLTQYGDHFCKIFLKSDFK